MLSIGLALVFYVTFYDLFVDTNRTHEVDFRPNTVGAPVDVFEKGKLGLQVTGRVRFDDVYHFANAPCGRDRNQQIDVILACIHFLELELRVMFTDGFDPSQHECLHAVVDNFASVFGRKHKMEVTEKYTVR